MTRKMDSTAPPLDWEPDAALATMAFNARVARARRTQRRQFAGLVALACCAMLALFPVVRTSAQRLWDRLIVGRVEVVRVDFDALSPELAGLLPRPLERPSEPVVASSIADAAARAHFSPRLPDLAPSNQAPRLSVTSSTNYVAVINAGALGAALRKVGGNGVETLRRWDGGTIRWDTAPILSAEFDGFTLVQTVPAVVSVPAGFDIRAYAEAFFRAAGLSRDDAGHVAERASNAPPLFLGMPIHRRAAVRDVQLKGVAATAVEIVSPAGRPAAVILIWSDADRIYLLTVLGEPATLERAIQIASSVH